MADARWMEVSLTVEGELAEALSDVMSRYLPNGVVVESGVVYNDAEDIGTPVGPVRIYGYLPVDETLEESRHRLEEALWHLGQIQPIPPLDYRTIEDEDWMQSWKQHYHPIPVGKRLLILPAWIENDQIERIPILIDPSMAFGTGTHPTTQLCMQALETYAVAGNQVIDVGCGSGILSITALKLGAEVALAVDIDPLSVKATRENADRNEIREHLEIGLGSVSEVLAGKFTFTKGNLVLANILAPVIIRLFEDGLADLLLPDGIMVLSGILDKQADDVLAAAEKHGLKRIDQLQQLDWVAIVLKNHQD